MMERRELFKVLGAAIVATREAAAQHDHQTPLVVRIEDYKPRFFSDQEYQALDALTDIIIPADDQSPGAHAAGVRYYLDVVLLYADPQTQQQWRKGLAAVDEHSGARFSKPIVDCTAAQKHLVIGTMAQNEKTPSTDLERFFATLKEMTVEAYALSDVGMAQHFGYRGNVAIQEFPGCTHPEHQRF
jgi:hypothetical protein